MAEKKVSNERRKELEQLDPFQESLLKGLAFLKAHKKQAVIVVTAVLSVIIVFSSVMISLKKSEQTAALLLSRSLNAYNLSADDPEKGYLAVKDDFETIFNEYANTAAGKQARLTFAKICYDASKFDQSLKFYQEALDIYDDQAMLKNLLLSSLGHVSVAKKDYKAAADYFEQIKASDSDLLKDEAQMTLAMLKEASGDTADSKKIYEKIVSEYSGSLYLPLAKSKINTTK
jgi:predicted negative regulator of RcsB-dependent stress response